MAEAPRTADRACKDTTHRPVAERLAATRITPVCTRMDRKDATGESAGSKTPRASSSSANAHPAKSRNSGAAAPAPPAPTPAVKLTATANTKHDAWTSLQKNLKVGLFTAAAHTSTAAPPKTATTAATPTRKNSEATTKPASQPITNNRDTTAPENTHSTDTPASPNTPPKTWQQLGLSTAAATTLANNGFPIPSPVQALAVPPTLAGRDILVRASNGAGKTLAFMAPIVHRANYHRGLQAIILVHYRELAFQTSRLLTILTAPAGIRTMLATGGQPLADDLLRMSQQPHILVGTPGRTIDLLSRGLCTVEDDISVIFDEADKLLDANFHKSVSQILALLPSTRQTLLYSATFPCFIQNFADAEMRTPLLLAAPGESLKSVTQFFVRCEPNMRLLCFKALLTRLQIDQCIVFCHSQKIVQQLAQIITAQNISAYFFHSEMSFEERNIVYNNFTKGHCKILVTTDIATRGLDAPGVNVVINFSLPRSSESYQHRVGRTGRFGREGCAISIISDKEEGILRKFVQAVGSSVQPLSSAAFAKFSKPSN